MNSGEGRNWVVHVDLFVDPDGSETDQATSLEAISKLLLGRTITIQDVVSVMGNYLTTTDSSIRARGIILLGELLAKLASTPLEDATIQSLSRFFAARLADWHCFRGALIGSIALLRRFPQVGAVEGSDVKNMAEIVLKQLHVQALGLNARLLALELFECLVNIHGSSISSMGSDLIYGICAAIESEKDPRCLLLAFRLVEHLGQLFPAPDGPLAECAEDLFDIVSRYFPVSFSPPPNDTRGISRDDLSEALLKVFTSTPFFAQFCIPLLLEKLSSSLRRAQLDSLRYLGLCALAFGPESISEHATAIWLALKAELLPVSVPASVSTSQDHKDIQIRDEALICLMHCVEAFQKGVEGDETQATGGLLKLICEDECIEDLLRYVEGDLARESEFKRVSDGYSLEEKAKSGSNILSIRADEQTQAIGLMLTSAVKASPSSCYFLTDKILNRLVSAAGVPSLSLTETQLENNTFEAESHQVPGKGFLSVPGLEVTVQILESASIVAKKTVLSSTSLVSTKMFTKKWLEPFCSVTPRLLITFSQVTLGQVLAGDHSKLGVAGLQALASFPATVSPLTKQQRQDVLSILADTFLGQTSASDVKENALDAIVAVSNLEEQFMPPDDRIDPTVVSVVTPKLLDAVQQAQTTATLKPSLQALAAIAGSRQVGRQVVLTGLRKIIEPKFVEAMVEATDEDSWQKMVSILDCLSQEIIPFCEKGSTDQTTACNIILDMWSAIQSVSPSVPQISEEVLSPLLAVNRVTVRGCPEASQEKIFSMTTNVLLNQDISSFNIVNNTFMKQEVAQDWTLCPRVSFTEKNGWLVALVASVTVGLLPAVVSPINDLLLKIFVRNSISEAGSLETRVAAQGAASLLNKWQGTSSGNGKLEGKVETLDEAIKEAVTDNLMPVMNQYLRATASDADESVSSGLDNEKIVRAVYALGWVGKGLAMRGHSQVAQIAALFLALLQAEGTKIAMTIEPSAVDQIGSLNLESGVGWAAAKSFGIIVKDDETCLDRVHNAVVRPLFKQRFFTSMLPPLQEAVSMAGNLPYSLAVFQGRNELTNVLVSYMCSIQIHRIWFFRAFGHLLSGTPHAAVLIEGKKVFPLVLEGLSTLCNHSEDSELLLSTLLTLSSFLTDDNHGRNIVAEYVPAMVNRLIVLVQYRSSWLIRETALQSLAAVVGLPFTRVFPMKPQVMKVITLALDDHKRRVRREAVRCRQVWSAIFSK